MSFETVGLGHQIRVIFFELLSRLHVASHAPSTWEHTENELAEHDLTNPVVSATETVKIERVFDVLQGPCWPLPLFSLPSNRTEGLEALHVRLGVRGEGEEKRVDTAAEAPQEDVSKPVSTQVEGPLLDLLPTRLVGHLDLEKRRLRQFRLASFHPDRLEGRGDLAGVRPPEWDLHAHTLV